MFEFDNSMKDEEKDSYHFVAYLPINGRLYELDGLKDGPVDLGMKYSIVIIKTNVVFIGFYWLTLRLKCINYCLSNCIS